MKKIIIVCGLIGGLIVTIWMLLSMSWCYTTSNYSGNMLVGYASMLIAFSLVFVGVKNYRDKQHGGTITFGKAFKVGFLIALIASTMYVLAWQIDFYFFIPDFYEKYTANMVRNMQNAHESAAAIQEQVNYIKQCHKNIFIHVLCTYAEILPLGLIVSLIAALILKRKYKNVSAA